LSIRNENPEIQQTEDAEEVQVYIFLYLVAGNTGISWWKVLNSGL
jgi:hypothetical protein